MSILDSCISVTSCVNCSPNIFFDASIALAGKNLFIYAANGVPLSGLYSLIRPNILLCLNSPVLGSALSESNPTSISLVNNSLSKLGASLLLSTNLLVIGLNFSIIYFKCTINTFFVIYFLYFVRYFFIFTFLYFLFYFCISNVRAKV